ncbi:hypothetical protein WUBG_09228 [Wuchereria bancrofti]|uniref:Uncharacterized protein n=1 Tax=Wuchereria bancrofti TaxID=6293 RepID=J9ERZ8_WUCBA|nr:hypothetical protein WUBG_09228 [Wuchereria bancrofti]VDM10133.1 unnamed protein product [Wuchereria bancrofti]
MTVDENDNLQMLIFQKLIYIQKFQNLNATNRKDPRQTGTQQEMTEPESIESAEYSQMSSSNKNSDVEDYYGYWQPYPNNVRSRRWFQQFEALKIGGPFCLRAIAACAIAYHVAYYTYQFTAVSPEYRQDLRHVMWLKRKLSVYPSIGIRCKEEIENFPEKR